MERVKKGGKYWRVGIYPWGIVATDDIDTDDAYDRQFSAQGNRFHTKEEAEVVARKLLAALKGADVIEMPSEEEAKAESERQLELSVACDDKWTEETYLDGFADCLHWIKSKMVK